MEFKEFWDSLPFSELWISIPTSFLVIVFGVSLFYFFIMNASHYRAEGLPSISGQRVWGIKGGQARQLDLTGA